MSVSSLNDPLLVASAGAASLGCLPLLERAIVSGAIPFLAVKVANCVLYALNVYATSQPGRIDGIQQEEMTKAKQQRKESKEMQQVFSAGRGRTLLAPSGWAFAIWGPIFLGELVFCVSHVLVDEASPVADVIKRASSGFMVAQVVQSLWTAAFRPKYKGKAVYVSSFLLTGIATALSGAHVALSAKSASFTSSEYLLYFLPMTLHFGWTTAACLVNWNGSLATWEGRSPQTIAWAGHLSVVAATVAGVAVTWTRQAPVFGGVIAWALSACATGMHQRIQVTAKVNPKGQQAGVYGSFAQKNLCIGGAVLSGLTAVVVTWTRHNGK